MQDRYVGSVLFVGLQSSCLGLGRKQLRAERLGVVRLRIDERLKKEIHWSEQALGEDLLSLVP
jgi:hypothetical protein